MQQVIRHSVQSFMACTPYRHRDTEIVVSHNDNGAPSVRLNYYGNRVALYSQGVLMVSPCGYATRSTVVRINAVLDACGIPARFILKRTPSNRNQLHISHKGKTSLVGNLHASHAFNVPDGYQPGFNGYSHSSPDPLPTREQPTPNRSYSSMKTWRMAAQALSAFRAYDSRHVHVRYVDYDTPAQQARLYMHKTNLVYLTHGSVGFFPPESKTQAECLSVVLPIIDVPATVRWNGGHPVVVPNDVDQPPFHFPDKQTPVVFVRASQIFV